jgi:hypothetical protein
MVAAKSTLELLEQDHFDTHFLAGGQYTPVRIKRIEGDRMAFHFGYVRELIDDIKSSFEKRRYHGFPDNMAPYTEPTKVWSAPITQRNIFQLEAFMGKFGPSPYTQWERNLILPEEIKEYCANRVFKTLEPYDHQIDMIQHGFSVRHFLWACEMGTGKTLAAIIMVEMLQKIWDFKWTDIVWAAPLSAIAAAQVDFMKWNTPIAPQLHSYQGLVKVVNTWDPNRPPPRILVLDESSRCKTPETQRSIAAQMIADAMRKHWGTECIIAELSGSPSPKTPADIWKQCEIVAPGFLSEANWYLFRERLGILAEYEGAAGGKYKKLEVWRDDEEKCKLCGKLEDNPIHDSTLNFVNLANLEKLHKYVKGVNEIEKLNDRTEGLVLVKFKKDCLDLPEKRYKIFEVEPTEEILRAAKLIVANEVRTVDALSKLRTLSDGFIYKDTPTGKKIDCPGCEAKGFQLEYFDTNDPDHFLLPDEIQKGVRYLWEKLPEDEDPLEFIPEIVGEESINLGTREIECFNCAGQKLVQEMHRTMDEVPCPKDKVLTDLLEMHQEIGRFNVYAGFQGSIDRICKICHQQGWTSFKCDGRGWFMETPKGDVIQGSKADLLMIYDQQRERFPYVCFVGNPGSAGMGITLTASPGTFFFSNDFNPENRTQAVDRGHRIGMDMVRGGWIYDCFHLPSDKRVYDSLMNSRRLELMALGALKQMYGVAA